VASPSRCRGALELAAAGTVSSSTARSSLSDHQNESARAAATVDFVSETKWLSWVFVIVGVICLLVAGTALGLAVIKEGGIGSGETDGDWVVAGVGAVMGGALLILGIAKA
jgi:hypothetical protein